MIFRFWFWPPFGSHFGGLLGVQVEAKAIKKPSQKNIKTMMPKMKPNWSQRGSQNGAKIVKNEVLEAPCFKGGSQEASRAPPGSILERLWDHFGTIFVRFSNIFVILFACIFSSMSQTKTFNITSSHPENAAESFQETASLFLQSCIEQFNSKC